MLFGSVTEKKPHTKFEITVITRDSNGQATGQKTLRTDNANEIYEFYNRNRPKPKKKRKSKAKKEKVITGVEAATIIREMYKNRED